MATKNNQITQSLKKFQKGSNSQGTVLISADVKANETDLKNLAIMIRNNFNASILIASFNDADNNFQNDSDKIRLITDIIDTGFLILMLYGTSFRGEKATFLSKTIILTGEHIFSKRI
jgi:hypothetical protein